MKTPSNQATTKNRITTRTTPNQEPIINDPQPKAQPLKLTHSKAITTDVNQARAPPTHTHTTQTATLMDRVNAITVCLS